MLFLYLLLTVWNFCVTTQKLNIFGWISFVYLIIFNNVGRYYLLANADIVKVSNIQLIFFIALLDRSSFYYVRVYVLFISEAVGI